MRKPFIYTLCFFIASISSVTLKAASNTVIIHEVFGGGGNAGAPYLNDYVVLYNAGATDVSLSGWSIQYATSTGSTWTVTNLTGTIKTHGYYLIKQGKGTGTSGASLPAEDALGTVNMNTNDGKVALRNSTTAFTTTTPTGAIDFIGYGAATTYEGSAAAPAISNTLANYRMTTADSDQNTTDFGTGAPAPKNSLYSPLPIELTRFDLVNKNLTTILTWETASEINNDYFEIEHSKDGVKFQNIGQVKGNGTTYDKSVYTFEFDEPQIGVNYFRLRQVDTDGDFSYSPIRSIVFDKSHLTIFPTLVRDVLRVRIDDTDVLVDFKVFNHIGQEVLRDHVQGETEVNASALNRGMYFLQTKTGDVLRFVKE